MIRSVLSLRAAAGKAEALEALYEKWQVLARARAFAGCREAVLLRSVDDPLVTHLVTADWDTAEDYRRWVDDPWRTVVSQQLAALLDQGDGEPVVGRLYEFA